MTIDEKIIWFSTAMIVLAGAIALFDKFFKKHEKLLAVLAFLFVLLGAGLSFFTSKRNLNENNETKQKNDSIRKANDSLNLALRSAQDSLNGLANQQLQIANRQLDTAVQTLHIADSVNHKQSQLITSQIRLSSQQIDAYNFQTGGNTIPILYVFPEYKIAPPDRNRLDSIKYVSLHFYLDNKGKYAIRNLKATVSDICSIELFNKNVKEYFNSGGLITTITTYKHKPEINDLLNYMMFNYSIDILLSNSSYLLHNGLVLCEPNNPNNPFSITILWNNEIVIYNMRFQMLNSKISVGEVLVYRSGKQVAPKNYFTYVD